MKGFASESLILGGVFLHSQQLALSPWLIALGIVGCTFRFLVDFNRTQKVDKILEAGEKFVTTFINTTTTLAKEAGSSWDLEKVINQKKDGKYN